MVYMDAIIGKTKGDRTKAATTITGENLSYGLEWGMRNFGSFSGSAEEFTELTGFKIVNAEGPELEKVHEIPSQPDDYYISVVPPANSSPADGEELTEEQKEWLNGAQRVLPAEQPGLTDNSDDEESTEGPPHPEPSSSESSSESSKPSEPSKPSKPGDESEKPEISTKADFVGKSTEVVAGAKIKDEVNYEGLVPGKKYTLNADLMDKSDKKSVLGEGETTFIPEESAGTVDVKITVDESVTVPAEKAVVFEELTSTEVDRKGEAIEDTDEPQHIAEHKDFKDKDQTVTSDDSDGHKKPFKGKIPWWAVVIPGIGLGKAIHDHHHANDQHKDVPQHEDVPKEQPKGHSDEHSEQDGVKVHEEGHRDGESNIKAPTTNGTPLPANSDRVKIKSVPSGATQLQLGIPSYVQ